MPRPITARLVGGLGNQLFGYFAGAALATHHGVPLRLDTSWTRHGMTDHGIEILAFDLPGEWLNHDSRAGRIAAPGTVSGRAFAKAVRDIPALGKLLRVHESPDIGHDTTLLDQPAGSRLRGYFQSWQIVQYAVEHGIARRPRLRQHSDWLESLIERARVEHPVAIHVRRGDYTRVPEFGLLGPSYYEPAIERVRELGSTGPLWLFSDEPDIAAEALGTYAAEAEYVASPDGPATEMLAMSHAAANVIANSTFSWWGAWMGAADRPVVAPDPWFSRGPVIHGLLPPSWSTVSSTPLGHE